MTKRVYKHGDLFYQPDGGAIWMYINEKQYVLLGRSEPYPDAHNGTVHSNGVDASWGEENLPYVGNVSDIVTNIFKDK